MFLNPDQKGPSGDAAAFGDGCGLGFRVPAAGVLGGGRRGGGLAAPCLGWYPSVRAFVTRRHYGTGVGGRLCAHVREAQHVCRAWLSFLGTAAGLCHFWVNFLGQGSTAGLHGHEPVLVYLGAAALRVTTPGLGAGPGCTCMAADPWPCSLSFVHTASSAADVTVASYFAQAGPWGGVGRDTAVRTPTT